MHAAIRGQDHAVRCVAGAMIVGDRCAIRSQEDAYLLVSAGLELDLGSEHRQETFRARLRQQVHLLRTVLQVRSKVDKSRIVGSRVGAAVNFYVGYGHEYVAVRPARRGTSRGIADGKIYESGRRATSASATPCRQNGSDDQDSAQDGQKITVHLSYLLSAP